MPLRAIVIVATLGGAAALAYYARQLERYLADTDSHTHGSRDERTRNTELFERHLEERLV